MACALLRQNSRLILLLGETQYWLLEREWFFLLCWCRNSQGRLSYLSRSWIVSFKPTWLDSLVNIWSCWYQGDRSQVRFSERSPFYAPLSAPLLTFYCHKERLLLQILTDWALLDSQAKLSLGSKELKTLSYCKSAILMFSSEPFSQRPSVSSRSVHIGLGQVYRICYVIIDVSSDLKQRTVFSSTFFRFERWNKNLTFWRLEIFLGCISKMSEHSHPGQEILVHFSFLSQKTGMASSWHLSFASFHLLFLFWFSRAGLRESNSQGRDEKYNLKMWLLGVAYLCWFRIRKPLFEIK